MELRGVQSGAAHATAVPTRRPLRLPPEPPGAPSGCLKFTVTAGAWYLVNAPDLAGLSVRRLLRCALKLCTKMDRFPSACQWAKLPHIHLTSSSLLPGPVLHGRLFQPQCVPAGWFG